MNQKEQIIITLKKIIYFKKDSQWYILKTDRGIAKGTIKFDIKEGDSLQLEGFYQISKFNGDKEFIFTSVMLSIPEDPRALLHYAVELTKGLGPSTEEQIWSLYADKWRECNLTELPRMTPEIIFAWQNTLNRLQEQKQQTQAIAFLISKSATMNMAIAAWNRWKETTISVVTTDCYKLADLPHYGFCDIDHEIRRKFGIADNDTRRIKSATLYVMGKISESQGSLIERQTIINELQKIIPDICQMFDVCMEILTKENLTIMLDDNNFALIDDWQNERTVWEKLCA